MTDETRPAAAEVWQRLADGNARFVAGTPEHPHQDPRRRSELAGGQSPIATVLGCSDSRAAAELLFDQGLGDLFVIRNAGQVADPAAVASIEYGVGVLGTPLVVVLGHQRCGAVQAAIDSVAPDAPLLPPLIDAHIDPIRTAVRAVGTGDAAAVGDAHVEATVAALLEASDLLAAKVADGSVDIVGAHYDLAEGRVERRFAVGDAS